MAPGHKKKRLALGDIHKRIHVLAEAGGKRCAAGAAALAGCTGRLTRAGMHGSIGRAGERPAGRKNAPPRMQRAGDKRLGRQQAFDHR